MTREEYDKEMLTIKSNLDIVPIMHKYISSLEQYIAELEAPKTCKTCKYYNNRYPYCDHAAECSRFPTLFDYYEPKGVK